MADIEKINIREFRNNIAKYTAMNAPFAVMKHGHTVGYYIPVQSQPTPADYATLRNAAAAFDTMMTEQGLKEETLFAEFQAKRKN